MKHRLFALSTLALAAALGGGCGILDSATASPTPAATRQATPAPAGRADEGGGDIPDPCTLLSKGDVTDLTDRDVTQIDEDGGRPGDATRYCQWQQSSGQLAVFLSRTTAGEFEVTAAGAETVDGVGEDAFWHSGHLYVRQGTVQIDVYSRGDSDAGNLADAKKVAGVLIPKVR